MNEMMSNEEKKALAESLREIADRLDEGVPVFDYELNVSAEKGEFAHNGFIHCYPTGVLQVDFSLHYQPFDNSEYEAMRKAGVFD